MGDLHGDPVLYPLRCLFFFGVAYTGFRFFSVALFVFFKFAFGAVYTGTPVFSLLRHLFFLGRGVRFFSAFNAVLFCTFVVWRVMRAFGYVFCYVWALGRRFEFAVSWLCECRLSHLGGGVNKKTHCPAGGPQRWNRPGRACGVLARLSRVGSEDVKLGVAASRDG